MKENNYGWIKRKKEGDKVDRLKNASDKEKKLNLILLSKLMDWCYIDKLTGQFYCKKCKNVQLVSIGTITWLIVLLVVNSAYALARKI